MKVKLDYGAYMPERAHDVDAGADLRTPEKVIVGPHSDITIDTGVHIEIPRGYFGKLESKSGLNVKYGIVSCGGVIDAGYTGSIAVKLYNLSDHEHVFEKGDKIVQLIIQHCELCDFEIVNELEDTERGTDGFGSTGR